MKIFFLINFHLSGEQEASICCVIKGSQSRPGGMASPLNAWQIKASYSCKIQVLNFINDPLFCNNNVNMLIVGFHWNLRDDLAFQGKRNFSGCDR